MKVILTESQYNRIILKEQEVEATADHDLIKIVKDDDDPVNAVISSSEDPFKYIK